MPAVNTRRISHDLIIGSLTVTGSVLSLSALIGLLGYGWACACYSAAAGILAAGWRRLPWSVAVCLAVGLVVRVAQ